VTRCEGPSNAIAIRSAGRCPDEQIHEVVLDATYEPEFVMFRDRVDAGVRLAQVLTRHYAKEVLVLGIPRGGVIAAGGSCAPAGGGAGCACRSQAGRTF
jgi:hypothetical protein